MEQLKKIVSIAIFGLLATAANAWKPWPLPMDSADLCRDSIMYGAELKAIVSSGKYAPFTFVFNSFGAKSAQPYSGNLSLSISKQATRPNRWYDYDFAVEGIGQIDSKHAKAFLQQAYAHVRLYVFDITAGIFQRHYGNQDATLSSGGLLFSANSRSLPRITVGIDNYTPFPLTFGYLEVKGGLSHGWFIDDAFVKKSFLHHKFIGGRLGGKLPVNISYEFHHAAQWGGYSPLYGDLGNTFNDFKNIFLARSGSSLATDSINAMGNHIGSQNIGLDVKGKNWIVSLYWQTLFEDGPIRRPWKAMNLPDGLWGISAKQSHWPFINHLVFEFVQTADQSGPFHDVDGFVFGGNDSYFLNSIYQNGWNYFGRTIGTPLITSPIYNSDGKEIATTNNRVTAHHFSISGDIFGYIYRATVMHTHNFGRYGYDNDADFTKNTAIFLQVSKHVEKAWGMDFSLSVGADVGSQFGNSFGFKIAVAKRGLIWEY